MDNTATVHSLGNTNNDRQTDNAADDITREQTTVKVTVKKHGIFTRMKRAFDNNPAKTAVGASLAIGAAALGGVNYSRYGSPLGPNVDNNDVREVVRAGASFLASMR